MTNPIKKQKRENRKILIASIILGMTISSTIVCNNYNINSCSDLFLKKNLKVILGLGGLFFFLAAPIIVFIKSFFEKS